jgi:cysteine desulfurase/selenocysteine lyase
MAATHAVGAIGVVDACQSVPHMPMRLSDTGADFVTWSGHKMLGPTGIGCLWGKTELLNAMPPFLSGGSMIELVTMEGSTFAAAPARFEAGVPMVAQSVGLGAAVRYLTDVGMSKVAEHEHMLTGYALTALQGVEGLRIIGPTDNVDRGSAISFVVEGIHPHDLGHVLDSYGVAVRVGHHCAWPTCRRMGVPATTRLSTYLYNDTHDIDVAVEAIGRAQEFFGDRG